MSNFELNLQGLNELMKGAEMQGVLREAGGRVASLAGEGFGTDTRVLNYVAVENVFPTTEEAVRESYHENALIKALGASGLRM